MITPFTLAVPQADLDDLKARLARVRWTDELSCVDTDYGVPLDPVKRLATYWQEGYDWRSWEAKLNAYPQFTTPIDGQNIHFLHIRSNSDDDLPLILTHGWPTSVVDYLDLIGPLTDPFSHGGEADQAFHLVIPSLPGFSFSGPTHDVGWNQYRTARAWAELMRRLGYDSYGAHGNDWGSVVSPEIGRFDPDHVVGVHVTQIFLGPSGDPAEMDALSAEEKEQWQAFQWWEKNREVYNPLQSTIPQTLAHALATRYTEELQQAYDAVFSVEAAALPFSLWLDQIFDTLLAFHFAHPAFHVLLNTPVSSRVTSLTHALPLLLQSRFDLGFERRVPSPLSDATQPERHHECPDLQIDPAAAPGRGG